MSFQLQSSNAGHKIIAMPGINDRFESTKTETNQPSVPPPHAVGLDFLSKVLIVLGIVGVAVAGCLLALRVTGLIRPFNVPTGAMAPTVSPGDHVVMEAISYRKRKPSRGDILVFKTDGIEGLPENQIYLKRVAGEANEHLKIANGKLFINGNRVTITNADGEISYTLPSQ